MLEATRRIGDPLEVEMGKGINKIMEGRTKLPETSELKFLLGGGERLKTASMVLLVSRDLFLYVFLLSFVNVFDVMSAHLINIL